MNYSKGICWIDDCRIPFVENEPDNRVNKKDIQKGASGNPFDTGNNNGDITTYKTEGRFPANLLVSDDMLNDGSISKSSGRKIYENDKKIDSNTYFLPENFNRSESNIKDKGTNSRYYDIDAWFNNLLENYIY